MVAATAAVGARLRARPFVRKPFVRSQFVRWRARARARASLRSDVGGGVGGRRSGGLLAAPQRRRAQVNGRLVAVQREAPR